MVKRLIRRLVAATLSRGGRNGDAPNRIPAQWLGVRSRRQGRRIMLSEAVFVFPLVGLALLSARAARRDPDRRARQEAVWRDMIRAAGHPNR